MKNLILILSLILVSGCATAPKFSWTNKAARLMIDPAGIPAEHYTMIQDALTRSDRFVVIDRPSDEGALAREAQVVTPEMKKTRWADWAKKYDIGGVVVAHVQCFKKYRGDKTYADNFCHQYLAIMSTSTGEEVAMAEGDNSAPAAVAYEYLVPDWDDVAADLAKKFSKNQDKLTAPVAIAKQEVEEEDEVEPVKVEAPKAPIQAVEQLKAEVAPVAQKVEEVKREVAQVAPKAEAKAAQEVPHE